jgi:hypothetical protein
MSSTRQWAVEWAVDGIKDRRSIRMVPCILMALQWNAPSPAEWVVDKVA